ncbi:hypothetical protein KGP36_03060 [Patescibacteria group bacterium]|nr:hypothetical protein [Patescibacteria group bacterium]
MLPFFIYFAGIAEALKDFSIFGAVLIVGAIAINFSIDLAEGGNSASQNFVKKSKWLLAVTLFFAIFTPSQQTVYEMIAGEVAQTVVETDTAKKALTVVNNWLDSESVKIKEDKK